MMSYPRTRTPLVSSIYRFRLLADLTGAIVQPRL